MKAEIISVGTEILLGEIQDTNSQFISSRLPAIGLDLYFISQVGELESLGQPPIQASPGLHFLPHPGELAHRLLRPLRIVPQGRVLGRSLELGEAFLLGSQVKDAPEGLGVAIENLEAAPGYLP